jgi:pimeloyl-ACP methyl ester carboxylesterase
MKHTLAVIGLAALTSALLLVSANPRVSALLSAPALTGPLPLPTAAASPDTTVPGRERRETTVLTGELGGAPYRIQIPADWNHNLVMYAHAYLPPGAAWRPLHDAFCAVFLERGFALAESGYSRQGWAFEEGLRETEALRAFFTERYGEPDSTFITGHSLGGVITLAAIERYPDAYNGALPLCGLLSPSLAFFRDRVFDMLVTFEFFFGASLPRECLPVIESSTLPPEIVANALASDSVAAAGYAFHWDVRREDLPRLLSFHHAIYRELVDRAGGNPIDNRNTVYSWPGFSNELNAAVRRYAADPDALAYLRRNYTPTGELRDPVIAVHTTYDPGVPPCLTNFFSTTTSLEATEKWFVQKWIEADGHCNIDAVSMGKAFDELRGWASSGIRPEPGVIR